MLSRRTANAASSPGTNLHSVPTARQQRVNGALKDPTALPKRSHSVVQTPSRGVIFSRAC